MDYTVCFREFERDYTWDNSHASHSVAEAARVFIAPGLEGALTRSRFAALLRSPTSPQGVMLCVSASTIRKDFVGRPIRTMAFLRAEKPEEANLLAAFFAECLRKPDAETLYNAESDVAKAVESLYQTKKPNDFLRFCRSLPSANGSGVKPTGSWEIRRDDVGSRQAMAESLPALIRGGEPFLIALTDRLPADVLSSLGSMFDPATVHIFSKAVSEKAPLPGGGPNTRVIAAAIGGVILLSALIVAAGKPCLRWYRSCKTSCGTNNVLCAKGGGISATNAPIGVKTAATNDISTRTREGETSREKPQDTLTTNAVPAEAETTMTNRLEQGGMMKSKGD